MRKTIKNALLNSDYKNDGFILKGIKKLNKTLVLLVFCSPIHAQNLLQNPGFEDIGVPVNSSGISAPNPNINPWVVTGNGGSYNVFRSDGSRRTGGGPATGADGGNGQHVDFSPNARSTQRISQQFTATKDCNIDYGASLAVQSQRGGGNHVSNIIIYEGNIGGTIIGQTGNNQVTSSTVWTKFAGVAEIEKGKTYTISITTTSHLLVDDVFVNYSNCPCCPPWDRDKLAQSVYVMNSGSIPNVYTLKVDLPQQTKTQLQAYVDYLNTVDPSITSIIIAFAIRDKGNGTIPGNSNGQIGTSRFIEFTVGGNGVPSNGNPNFFSLPAEKLHANGTWYEVGTGIYLNDNKKFFPKKCAENSVYYRQQFYKKSIKKEGSNKSLKSQILYDLKLKPTDVPSKHLRHDKK